jgi:hypothetical protein
LSLKNEILTFVAQHSLPPGLADALKALVAVPVDASGQANTLFAKLPGPENGVTVIKFLQLLFNFFNTLGFFFLPIS